MMTFYGGGIPVPGDDDYVISVNGEQGVVTIEGTTTAEIETIASEVVQANDDLGALAPAVQTLIDTSVSSAIGTIGTYMPTGGGNFTGSVSAPNAGGVDAPGNQLVTADDVRAIVAGALGTTLVVTTYPVISVTGGGQAIAGAVLQIDTAAAFSGTPDSTSRAWKINGGTPAGTATGTTYTIQSADPAGGVATLVYTAVKAGQPDQIAVSNSIVITSTVSPAVVTPPSLSINTATPTIGTVITVNSATYNTSSSNVVKRLFRKDVANRITEITSYANTSTYTLGANEQGVSLYVSETAIVGGIPLQSQSGLYFIDLPTGATFYLQDPSTAYQQVAIEGGTIATGGDVLYGTGATWSRKTVSDGAVCSATAFGDPATGLSKVCREYVAAGGETRDPWLWPFSSSSIWNMPLGSNAEYTTFSYVFDSDVWGHMPGPEANYIIMTPNAPQISIREGNWSGDRCPYVGSTVFETGCPVPSDFVAPSASTNSPAGILRNDGDTITNVQPFTRCTAGSNYATATVQWTDDSITGDGLYGAQGGSGMSSIGGALRLGELRPGQTGPKHALKCVWPMKWAYRPTQDTTIYPAAGAAFRWPANNCDTGATGTGFNGYGDGASNPNSNNRELVMGALLAIPASTDIDSLALATEPARQIAWTLQNYGMYIVDTASSAHFNLAHEISPSGDFTQQFQSDYGYSFFQRRNATGLGSAWMNDMRTLLSALVVVSNNAVGAVGGGGTPRQALAPALGTGGQGGTSGGSGSGDFVFVGSQGHYNADSGTAISSADYSVPAPINTAAGALIVVEAAWEGGDTTCTITNTAGDTFTAGPKKQGTNSQTVATFYCLSSAGNATNHTTATLGAARTYRHVNAAVFTYTGTCTLDQSGDNSTIDTALVTGSDTVTGAGNNLLVVGQKAWNSDVCLVYDSNWASLPPVTDFVMLQYRQTTGGSQLVNLGGRMTNVNGEITISWVTFKLA